MENFVLLCIAVYIYIYIFISVICSYTREYMEHFTDSTKDIVVLEINSP